MKRRRHTPEQVVRKLREADRLLGEGQELPEVLKALEISEATYHRWRAQFGGMKADDVKRLKELEAENARLKRIVADQVLEVAALKEVGRETGEPVASAPGGSDAARPLGSVGAAGVRDRRPTSLDAAPSCALRGRRSGLAGGVAPDFSPPAAVGVPARASAAPRAGLAREP